MREAVRKAYLELFRRTGADFIEVWHSGHSEIIYGKDVRKAKKKPKKYGTVAAMLARSLKSTDAIVKNLNDALARRH